jgi:flagellar biosynthetic protein FlhB
MAEGDDGSKTEEATAHRLEEARKEGDVPKSTELTQAAALAGAVGAVAIGGGYLAQNLAQGLLPFIAHPETMDLQGGAGQSVLMQVMNITAPSLLAVLGATMVAGIAGNVLQQGILFTPSKLAPKWSKVSPVEGFKRLFGIDGFVGFIRSLLKVGLTISVAWWALAPHAAELPQMIGMGPIALLNYTAGVARDLLFAVLALLAVIAIIDLIWQRQRFLARMRMTKEELKEDFRQSEGDPHIKGRQKQIRMQRAKQRMIQQVPKATVIVVNPTHYAVALRYEQGETPAPQCVAKGVDEVAAKIREIAEQHGIPLVEDPPLARALYAAVEVDQTIPHQHYEAVAKIIGFILAAKRPRGRARTL